MADYVDNDIVSFRNIYLKDKEIKNIIAVGEVVSSLKKIVPELSIKDVITRAQFDAMYKRVISMRRRSSRKNTVFHTSVRR